MVGLTAGTGVTSAELFSSQSGLSWFVYVQPDCMGDSPWGLGHSRHGVTCMSFDGPLVRHLGHFAVFVSAFILRFIFGRRHEAMVGYPFKFRHLTLLQSWGILRSVYAELVNSWQFP